MAVLVAMAALGCTAAPEPGDVAAFCSLLSTGTGLTPAPTAEDLERLALVAPPDVRPTIDALQNRARDFTELLAEDPPDLEALFNARYDPQASREQAKLDEYARTSCGIAAERPPATRWTTYVQNNHADSLWANSVAVQFEVEANTDRVDTGILVFADAPEPIGLVEDACRAMSEFLVGDDADPGRVRVFIGSVVALEYDSPNGACQLP